MWPGGHRRDLPSRSRPRTPIRTPNPEATRAGSGTGPGLAGRTGPHLDRVRPGTRRDRVDDYKKRVPTGPGSIDSMALQTGSEAEPATPT